MYAVIQYNVLCAMKKQWTFYFVKPCAAIMFIPSLRILLVQYRDGSVYTSTMWNASSMYSIFKEKSQIIPRLYELFRGCAIGRMDTFHRSDMLWWSIHITIDSEFEKIITTDNIMANITWNKFLGYEVKDSYKTTSYYRAFLGQHTKSAGCAHDRTVPRRHQELLFQYTI